MEFKMGSCGDFCATCNEVCIGRYTNEQLIRELRHRGSEIYEINKERMFTISVTHEGSLKEDLSYHADGDGPVTILVIKGG
jgi:hypothetical protein